LRFFYCYFYFWEKLSEQRFYGRWSDSRVNSGWVSISFSCCGGSDKIERERKRKRNRNRKEKREKRKEKENKKKIERKRNRKKEK